MNETPELPEESQSKKEKSGFRDSLETLLVAFVLAVITRAAVAEPRYIPSESMLPTLKVHDRLIVEKVSNYAKNYRRGDILVFYPPLDKEESNWFQNTLKWLGLTSKPAYIKRVVGLPGETFAVHDGKVWINGKPLNEDYIQEEPAYDVYPRLIEEGHFFMMGDNRNNSMDSHVWGSLPIENVIGHAVFRFWPPQRIGLLN